MKDSQEGQLEHVNLLYMDSNCVGSDIQVPQNTRQPILTNLKDKSAREKVATGNDLHCRLLL